MTDVILFNEQYLQEFRKLSKLKLELKRLESEEKAIKQQLQDAFEEFGIDSIDNEYIKISRVKGSTSKSIDLDKLKDSEPQLYEELFEDYPKLTERKSYIRFTVK